MEKAIADSVHDFVQIVSETGKKTVTTGVFKNEVLLFRGHSDQSWRLLPSIARGERLHHERNYVEMAKYRFPEVFKSTDLPVEMLALLQHHGIPTRLLDVTENSLVALYFACEGNPEKAGEVFIFKENQTDVSM